MKIQTWLYLITLLFQVQSLASSDQYIDSPNDLGFYSNSYNSRLDFNWRFNLDSFRTMLERASQNKTIKDVESLLPLLPQALRSNYVVMYQSRSLQQASPENPRILMFTPRADFILTFNGHSSQRGYEKLELMNFDYNLNQFVFHEVSFDQEKGYQISQPNPAVCMKCHQSNTRTNTNPRPNWEPYSLWPGALGSNDGHFASAIDQRLDYKSHMKSLFSVQDQSFLKLQKNEKQILENFIKTKKNHPRYQYLIDLKINRISLDEPSELTDRLANLNARRVVQEIKNLPQYENLKEIFLSVVKCDKLNVSDSTREWLKQNRSFDEFSGITDKNKMNFSDLIHLTFEPFGIDTSDWSMDFKTRGRMAFRERFGTPSNTTNHFLRAINYLIPEHTELNCHELEKKSEIKMERLISEQKLKLQSEIQITDSVRIQKIITNCMSCHDGSSDAPIINFDRSNLLKNEIHQLGYKRGTLLKEIEYRMSDMVSFDEAMPANQVLKKEEVDLFLKYLNGL